MWLSLCPCSGVYNPPEGPVVVGRLSNKQIVVDVALWFRPIVRV